MKSPFTIESDFSTEFETEPWAEIPEQEITGLEEEEWEFPEDVPAPPIETPPLRRYQGITGKICPSGRGKCWNGRSRDIIDSDAPWNDQTNRSASNYSAVLDYFNPGTCRKADCLRVENQRYRRTATATWCNIYVHDVTRAMWASIPHWIRDATQKDKPVGWNELSANRTVHWMLRNARTAGWIVLNSEFCEWIYNQVTQQRSLAFPGRAPLPAEIAKVVTRIVTNQHSDPALLKQRSYVAQQFANAGLPTVTIWRNKKPNGHGHMSMVRPETPSSRGQLNSDGCFVPRSAQAGARNFANDLASWIIGKKDLFFYVHA